MSMGIDKILYMIGMVFNIKAHNRRDTLVYPYIPACTQHWFEPKYAQNVPCSL